MRHIIYFYLREQKLDILQHYQLLALSFNCHHSQTWDQLKWKTSSLLCWIHNQIKLLIVLPKFKVILEGGQQLYNKNAKYQGLVFIQIRNECRTRENLVTWVPVDLYRYRSYLTTIHWPIKRDRSFNAITSTFFTFHSNLLSTLGLLRKSNEGGAWLLLDSELPQ